MPMSPRDSLLFATVLTLTSVSICTSQTFSSSVAGANAELKKTATNDARNFTSATNGPQDFFGWSTDNSWRDYCNTKLGYNISSHDVPESFATAFVYELPYCLCQGRREQMQQEAQIVPP
jgi:hypothetical protein